MCALLATDYHIEKMIAQPVSGPTSPNSQRDIRERRTPHDIRLATAVEETGWPLLKTWEAAPLQAGSVIIYSHNLFHRGNHRRDAHEGWKSNPRYMFRFFVFRTHEPTPTLVPAAAPEHMNHSIDWLTGVDVSEASSDITVVWEYQSTWLRNYGGSSPPASVPPQQQSVATLVKRLAKQLEMKHQPAEVARIGAAYKLAALASSASGSQPALAILGKGIRSERESVRRAAMYGLAAVGSGRATQLLLHASTSDVKWVRKAACFGLGECGTPTQAVLTALVDRLNLSKESSVYVRSVAAAAIGCLIRRAAAAAAETFVRMLGHAISALNQALQREVNRLPMDIAQGRGIKFVRPTDDCDVCEGHAGPTFGGAFEQLRSAVRENVLWAYVILMSHNTLCLQSDEAHQRKQHTADVLSPALRALEYVAQTDKNVISVGLATDALHRLASGAAAYTDRLAANGVESSSSTAQLAVDARTSCMRVVTAAPVLCWESLCRSTEGMRALRQDWRA